MEMEMDRPLQSIRPGDVEFRPAKVESDPRISVSGEAAGGGGIGSTFSPIARPKIRLTSEYDSDTSIFFHKISCKLLDDLAKLKLSFQNNNKGEVTEPQVSFKSKFFSLMYDVEESDALFKTSFDVSPGIQFKGSYQVKAQQGEIAAVADLAGPKCKLELSNTVPFGGMPKATLQFPFGEVCLSGERDDETEEKSIAAVSGIFTTPILNGVCSAQYSEGNLGLRYLFKDNELTFIPSISLPSNALSFAFKRSFTPSDKMSYWYNMETERWTAVYKRKVGKDFKFKIGYDSDVRLSWASIWVGEEDGKAKSSPLKMKLQLMVQVPEDDLKSSVLMFRVKKRWDI